MNGTYSVEIKFNNFNAIAKSLPTKVGEIVRKAAFDILARGSAYAPIRTGFPLNSGGVRVGGGMAGIFGGGTATSAEVFWAAFYAIYQNFGTRFIAPVLFANRAASEVAPSFIAAMKSIALV
jgi:hypothetical protein